MTKHILAVNTIPLIALLVGLLYLDQYRDGLIASELEALTTEAKIFAGALGEIAAESHPDDGVTIRERPAREVIRRLVATTQSRARLFDKEGALIVDSRILGGKKSRISNSIVQVEDLSDPYAGKSWIRRNLSKIMDRLDQELTVPGNVKTYKESFPQTAFDYPEVQEAISGNTATALRKSPRKGELILYAAVPVQHYRQVLGALMVSQNGEHIEKALHEVRLSIFRVFLAALCLTALLSMYLARTITRPVLKLAGAARRMGMAKNRAVEIPDLSGRRDEIGELSAAMRDLTSALWERMDAIERFAADVAHEIKNPLNSLRSAVETASRIDDVKKQKQLLQIILDDVTRLDRLITDISESSRIDSEISRGKAQMFEVTALLAPIVQHYDQRARSKFVSVDLFVDPTIQFYVEGIPSRLTQAVNNLLENAISFSPQDGLVGVHVSAQDGWIDISVTDQGPGIPQTKLDKIFDRFYSDRPSGEKFGLHSGLGLSIAKQIITAMGGKIEASNRMDASGKILGAQLRIALPAA